MFGWFRKKKKPRVADVLRMDDARFVEALNIVIKKEDSSRCAMIVVAYCNLSPILEVSLAQPGLPKNLDEVLCMLAEKIETETDDIGLRRCHWFLLAGLIKRATDKQSIISNSHDKIADIWLHLINGSKPIVHLLKHNVIWSDSEKTFFMDVHDEKSGMEYTLNLVAPKWIREHPTVINFANDQGLHISSF
jgi:hypothetical protein